MKVIAANKADKVWVRFDFGSSADKLSSAEILKPALWALHGIKQAMRAIRLWPALDDEPTNKHATKTRRVLRFAEDADTDGEADNSNVSVNF